MAEACECGRDSSATCPECHRRVWVSHYALSEGEPQEYWSAFTLANPPPAPDSPSRSTL